jgi:hypothetical protein
MVMIAFTKQRTRRVESYVMSKSRSTSALLHGQFLRAGEIGAHLRQSDRDTSELLPSQTPLLALAWQSAMRQGRPLWQCDTVEQRCPAHCQLFALHGNVFFEGCGRVGGRARQPSC